MNEAIVANIAKYAKMLFDKKYIESGYIAVKEADGICITTATAQFADIKADDVVFVNDKNIESFEGNFRAAAVILFCAVRQDKNLSAAAIVDSDSILKYSSKRLPLKPILDDLAQVCGVSIKCASKNVAAEVVTSLTGLRNCCFLPDAGAVVTGRTLDEVFTATLVLDKACNAELLAEGKGGTQNLGKVQALLEHVVYKLKYSKKNQQQQKQEELAETANVEQQKPAQETEEQPKEATDQPQEEQEKPAQTKSGDEQPKAEPQSEASADQPSAADQKPQRPSAIVTDQEKAIAQAIKDAGTTMLDENLVQGTWGNIAVKLDGQYMLATPSGIDYVLLKPQQIAKVDMKTLEWTGTDKATSEKGIHAALLAQDGINATIHSHPFYGCILAAMNRPLPVPAEYMELLGEEIPCAKAALPGTKGLIKNVLEAIGDAPACFLAHHGVIVRGKDLASALEICRALEKACEAYLTAK